MNFYPTHENGYHGDFPPFWKSGILRPADSFVVCTKIFQKVIGPYKSMKQEKTGTLLLLGLGLYSFHLFATYICNVWPRWCVFTLFYRVYIIVDSFFFFLVDPNNFWEVFILFKCCDWFIYESFFKSLLKTFGTSLYESVIFNYGRYFVWFYCVSFSVIRSILFSKLMHLRCSFISDG